MVAEGRGALVLSEAVQQALDRLNLAGVELDVEALQALEKLPSDHAVEILTYVAENHNYLRNPSKYVTSTCARGFVPKPAGKGTSSDLGQGGGTSVAATVGPGAATDPETMEKLLLKAQQVGVTFTNEALNAMANLSQEKAAELLESVLDRSQELRDPSQYIVNAVMNGFQLKRTPGYGNGSGGYGAGQGADGNQGLGMNPKQVPPDITPLERRVLQVNTSAYPQGEQIDLNSYLALRCLPDWHAAEMLDTLEAKHGAITSPCNYIQAAVSKIQRGHHHGRGGDYGEAGDPKRQRMW